jgi:hypothetical protein
MSERHEAALVGLLTVLSFVVTAAYLMAIGYFG